MRGAAEIGSSNRIGAWPASTSDSAGPAPLYGTWPWSMPASERNISPARCDPWPLPADAKMICPGLAFAAATSSRTLPTPSEGCTTMYSGRHATMLTVLKSRSVS